MDTTDEPRDSPGSPAIATALADWERRSERHSRANAKRKPQTPEQVARYALRARLRACLRSLDALAAEVERKQGDRSGAHRMTWVVMKPPADDSDLRGISATRPKLLDQWERIELEAADGCSESAAFIAEHAETLRLCLHLRHERPPERSPDYDPLEALSDDQRAWIAQRR